MMFYLLLLCLFGPLSALEKSVCLNMVLREDAKNISSCLSSVKPYIDYWVIVDAGASGKAGKLAKEILKEIPGELHFRSEGSTKALLNEALSLAKEKGDYLLMIQPTEELRVLPEFTFFPLEKDCYFIKVNEADTDFQRIFLISTKLNWYWKGSLYPTLLSEQEGNFDLIVHADIVSAKTDTQTLEESFKQDPTNAGLLFRLAQSYQADKEYGKAIQYYEKRIQLGGWKQEVFWSLYQIANMTQLLKAEPSQIIENYYKAYQYSPTRIEPLYRLANYYFEQKQYFSAYTLIQQALAFPYPYEDRFFLEEWIYHYGLLVALSDCCWFLGNHLEAKEACQKVLAKENIPVEIRKSVEKNVQLLEDCRIK